MKIALAQLNYNIGNFESNIKKSIEAIKKAKSEGADLVVFGEMSVSGYPPRDFLEFNDYIENCLAAVRKISIHCKGIAAIVGSPTINPVPEGKDLYNSAYFLSDGCVKQVVHKTLLPNYDIFDEYRYFEPNKTFKVIEFKDKKIALTICEDLWDVSDNPMYTQWPMEELIKQKPDLIINISASPFHYNKAADRKNVLSYNAKKYNLPLIYVNHVGAQTELLFDGGSMFIDKNGGIVDELAYFEEDFKVYNTEKIVKSSKQQNKTSKIENIHDALVMGIKNYFEKLGFTKAVLGLSGGIDSAVTLVLAVRALGNENVQSILLPSQFSSEHSIDDALQLAKKLSSPYKIISIKDIYDSFNNSLQPYFKDLVFNVTEENIQSRSRAVILMALCNKFGYILLNTSNKSEAAVGYGTLYGDMCGGLSVIGDVYKTDVFALARFINNEKEIIPENTITKPPSAELRPNQKDSDSLPEYDILDEILYQYIEKYQGPKDLINMGFEKIVVDRILKLVNSNEHKRYQTPPMLRISPKSFGIGRRMPIVGKYLS